MTINLLPKNPRQAFIAYAILVLMVIISLKASGQVDLKEFPVGYTDYSAVAPLLTQVQTSPTPRFKTGHTLIPNYSWIDPLYAGGYKQSGVNDAQACHNSNDIQLELAKNFNYIILLQWGGVQINDSSVSLANRYPQYKRGITTLRAQTKGCSGSSCLWCGCLDGQYYLQDSQGRYLGWGGEIINYKGTWRPTSPVSVWNQDGINAKNAVAQSLTNLVGNIDYINEDGEVYPICSNYALESDPMVKANMGTQNPQIYLAQKLSILDNAYRAEILSLPKMQNSKYSEYRLDGHRTFQLFWEGTRYFNTPMNGQYYSTGDFYPRYPNNWKDWISAWHGLKWVTQSRYHEIRMGDKLCSMYFGLGWDADAENNVLSAQGLGLAKLLTIYGTEYFFPGYFIENLPAPNPKSYAYQYLIPIYAQGIASHMENILRNGILMDGDMVDYTNTDEFGTPTPIPKYQFNTLEDNKVVAARKLGNEYWIVGTIQNNSNVAGNTPINSNAIFNLRGTEMMKIKIRRQGSSYYYNEYTGVFYQLDGWHQYQHPTRWTKDWNNVAPVCDATTGTIKTYNNAAPNYTKYRTVVSLQNNQTINYSLTTRNSGKKYLYIKTTGGQVESTFDGVKKTTTAINGWHKISIGTVSANPHTLIIKALSSFEIDSLSISSNANKY